MEHEMETESLGLGFRVQRLRLRVQCLVLNAFKLRANA